MTEDTFIRSLSSKNEKVSTSKADKFLNGIKSSSSRKSAASTATDSIKTSSSYTSSLSSTEINKIFLQRIGETLTGDSTTVSELWDYIQSGNTNNSYNSLRKGFIYTLDISDYYKTTEDIVGKDYWSSTHSFDSRVAPSESDFEKYDTDYKKKYNDVGNSIGVTTKLKYVATDSERALHTYYTSSSVLLEEQKASGKIAVLCGIDTYGTKLATALNKQLTDGASVTKSASGSYDYNGLPIEYSQFEYDATNKIIAQKTRFPDIYYYCYSNNSKGGFYSYATLDGYGTTKEFLLSGGKAISSSDSLQQNITKHMIKTVKAPMHTASVNSATRHKYLNEAIGLLEESMPDFSPNMFDVLLVDMAEKIDYSRVPTSNPLITNSWGHTAFNGPVSSYSDRYSYENSIIPERTFAFRVGSISIPQAETSKEDRKFLNTTVPSVNSSVKMNYSSSLTLRLDQAMLFADRFTKESGNFIFDRIDNIPEKGQIYQSARKMSLHSVFFPSGTMDGTFSSYNLANPEQNIKRNLYIRMIDKTTSSQYGNYVYNYGISHGDKTLYNDAKLITHPMYCFEDVRFLGIDGNIQFKSDSASALSVSIPFIFRRSYKIVDQN